MEGKDYYFVSREAFEEGIAARKFIEAGYYNGNLYGTSLAELRELAEAGKVVVLDNQLKAVQRLQRFGGLNPVVILLKPTSRDDLISLLHESTRLTGASKEPVRPEEAQAMLKTAADAELLFRQTFTHVVHLGTSLADAIKAVARIVLGAYEAPFWSSTQQELPLAPPPRLSAHVAKMAPWISQTEGLSRRGSTDSYVAAAATVVAERNASGSFGFSVMGGSENEHLPAIALKPDVVPIIVSGEPLHRGDEIISVNGRNVANASHDEVIQMIKGAGQQVCTRVCRQAGWRC